ncbi:MAG: hypothetical protein Q8N09_05980 [Thermodesulfovibrionia bacterium]|nr:hypothetical protein [Thermodesulfovibrionia bacterium]
MGNTIQIDHDQKENWFIKNIKKYQVITFTFGFLLLYRFSTFLIGYFADKNLFLERFGLNIWFWAIGIPIIYFLQWLLVVCVASKLSKDKLQQKFLRHPIATIILFILYVTDLPYRLAEYGGNITNIFETIVYYAFVSFLWWLLVCWISTKIFKKQRFQWRWYKKIMEKFFVVMPIAYKVILGLIIAFLLFFIIFLLLTIVFKYSGQDLKMLFS